MNLSNGYLYKINIIIKLNYTFIKINIESFRFDSTTVLKIRDEFLSPRTNTGTCRPEILVGYFSNKILTEKMFCCLLKLNVIE